MELDQSLEWFFSDGVQITCLGIKLCGTPKGLTWPLHLSPALLTRKINTLSLLWLSASIQATLLLENKLLEKEYRPLIKIHGF
jgi:hypothetical protein